MITAQVPGIGTESDYVSLYVGSTDICETATVTEYGVLKCLTKNTKIGKEDAPAQLTVKIGKGRYGKTYNCASSDTTKCQYMQLDQSKMDTRTFPIVIAVSKTEEGTGLTLIGSKFYTEDYTASVIYCGVTADSVVVSSASLANAVWNKGLPPCQTK